MILNSIFNCFKRGRFLYLLLFVAVFFNVSIYHNDQNYFSISNTAYAGSCSSPTEKSDCDSCKDTEASRACWKAVETKDDSTIGKAIKDGLRGVIYYVFVVPMTWLLSFGVWMAGLLMKPEIFQTLFSSDKNDFLYAMWSFVRDFLNLMFVFVLLFSAFATVFQIQKYHLKNTLLMIVLMALLVNFSWPITRVIIDAGNVTMYYFIDQFVSGDASVGDKAVGLMGETGDSTGIVKALIPENKTAYNLLNPVDLVIRGIFIFVYAITFMAIAVIFLIRLVAFVLLLIFSPVGFVTAIFPSTRQYASSWWSALFKWAFIGPIMVFMLVLSKQFLLKMTGALNTGDSVMSGGYGASSVVTKLLGDGVIYVAGAVILWAGILAGNKLGGGLASAVTSRARTWGTKGLRNVGRFYAGAGRTAGRVIDNKLLGNSVAKTVGRISNVRTRWNTVGDSSKKQWAQARLDSSSRGLAGNINARKIDENSTAWQKLRHNMNKKFGRDPVAAKKANTEAVATYEKENLRDKVDLSTMIDMREAESNHSSVKAQALDKAIAAHKDLQYIKSNGKNGEADRLVELIKSGAIRGANATGIESSLKKNGNPQALKPQFTNEAGDFNAQAFADKVVKKLDAESLAKSAKLLEEAAQDMKSPIAKEITNKMQFEGFRNDFLKHAGAQGTERSMIKKFEDAVSQRVSQKTTTDVPRDENGDPDGNSVYYNA